MPTTSSHPWKSMLLCFGGAALIWLFGAFSKVYTTKISYPVCFVTDPPQQVFTQVPAPLASITLEVTGSGWSLLRHLLNINVQPIEVSTASISSKEHTSEYLRLCFDKKIKDLTVHKAWFDGALPAYTLPQTNPCDP